MILTAAFYSCVSRQEVIDVDNQNTRHRGCIGRGRILIGNGAADRRTPAGNAGISGGPGTHQDAQKTGSASNKQKVERTRTATRAATSSCAMRQCLQRPGLGCDLILAALMSGYVQGRVLINRG